MHAFFFGVIGLTPREYYLLTPYESYCIAKGYRKKQLEQWRMARFTGWCAISAMGAKVKMEDLLPLEGDNDNRPSIEDMKQITRSLRPVRKKR